MINEQAGILYQGKDISSSDNSMNNVSYHGFMQRVLIEEDYNMPYLASWERNAIKEGVKQGVIQEKKRTAKEMLKKDIDLDTVTKITGLDRKQVEKLLATSH